jgi:uncharacterized membrane protein (UPF0127 family)
MSNSLPGRGVAVRPLALLALLLPLLARAVTPSMAEGAPAPTVRPDWPHGHVEITTQSGQRRFAVDIADTPERQELGLMQVRKLPRGLGMLFPVDPPGRMQMWMKDTYLSLDMVFIGADDRIACVRERTTPQSLENINCPHDVHAVLEIAAGVARRLGIHAGDEVALPARQPPVSDGQ